MNGAASRASPNAATCRSETPAPHRRRTGVSPYVLERLRRHAQFRSGDLTVNNTATQHHRRAALLLRQRHHGVHASGSVAIDNAGTISVAPRPRVGGHRGAVQVRHRRRVVSSSGDLGVTGYSNGFGIIAKGDAGGTVVDNTGTIGVQDAQRRHRDRHQRADKYSDAAVTTEARSPPTIFDTV